MAGASPDAYYPPAMQPQLKIYRHLAHLSADNSRPPHAPQTALLVGKRDAWLTNWLASQLADRNITTRQASYFDEAARIADRRRTDDAGGEVDMILIAQQRPGELPRNLPARLAKLLPSAQLLSVAGSWCEGELRTGQPWPDVERVYWHAFTSWLDRQRASAWPRQLPQPAAGTLIAISALHRETASAVADSLKTGADMASVWLPRVGPQPLAAGFAAAIWVGGQLDGGQADKLANFCRQMRKSHAPVVAMLDFPRPDEWQLARKLGVTSVHGKPWDADAVTAQLRQLSAQQLAPQIEHRRAA